MSPSPARWSARRLFTLAARTCRPLTTVAATAWLTGCFPLHAQVRPPLGGQIVDASSGLPVKEAAVVVETWRLPVPPRYSYERVLLHSMETRSDARGARSVPEEKDWTMAILAADGFPVFGNTVCVVAAGYESFVMNPWAREKDATAGDHGAGREVLQSRVPDVVRLTRGRTIDPRSRAVSGGSRCGIPAKPFR